MWLWCDCDCDCDNVISYKIVKRNAQKNKITYFTIQIRLPSSEITKIIQKRITQSRFAQIFYSTGPWSDTALHPKLSPHNPSTWQRPRPTRSSGWSSGSPPPWWGCPLTFVIIIIKTNTISIIILWSGSPPPQWNLLSDLYNTYMNLLSNMLVLDSTIK